MPPLSPATRRANAQRRFNLNRYIEYLKNHYEGTFRGRFGRTATARQMNVILGHMQELAARRIQRTVRARQARRRAETARAVAHTRARAPRNAIIEAAWSPRRLHHIRNTYGNNELMRRINNR